MQTQVELTSRRGAMSGSPLTLLLVLAMTGGLGGDAVSLGGSYDLVATVLMHDSGKDPVGYQLTGAFNVHHVHPQLVLIQLAEPKLHIMSRKAPTPLGFVEHASPLDTSLNNPFLVRLEGGEVKSMFANPEEPIFMLNFKRGLSSLFQFQLDDSERKETDSSGVCNVSYTRSSSNIVKVKSGCIPQPIQGILSSNVWSGKLKSRLETMISLSGDGGRLESLVAKESHSLGSNIADYTIARVTAETELKFKGDFEGKIGFSSGNLENKINEIGNYYGVQYKELDLLPDKEAGICSNEACQDLATVIRENKKHLKTKEMGTSKSALAAIRLIHVIRDATTEDIYKTINSKENKEILPQLMDILGASQSKEAHQAALKKLKINSDYNLDLCERYFWSLSMSPEPNKIIIKDLMQMMSDQHKDAKLWETIVFSLAAMAKHHFDETKIKNAPNDELLNEVTRIIEKQLKKCKSDDDNCKQLYLKALSNIASPTSLPTLLQFTVGSSKKVGLGAMFGISKLGPENWNEEVMKTAERVFFVNDYDSSARTIALDIILEMKPSKTMLAKLVSILKYKDSPKELKEYLLQRFNQISDWDENFKTTVNGILYKEGMYNYNSLAQGGLSTAFTRGFMNGGSLSTTQEVSSGILKRGNVHINLHHNNATHTLFTLGIFSKGLGSFVSSESGEEADEDESASAGLELTVLGVGLRKFVFFDGQGELMGHVWSGTGSTKTPAYQALLLLGKERTYISLANGFLADVSLIASASVDLSGQIEISLWNKNAESLVQNSAGIALEGAIKIDSSLVKTKVEFNLMAEPRLDLSSSIEFSDNFALCLQLQQPNSSIRYNTYKVERIPGSKHKLRKSRYKTIPIPGKTYALNAKNSEMCSLINESY